jgi:hypothetical protein
MLEKIKDYFLEVAMKKYAPMAAMGAVAALGTFMLAHAGMLEQYGITYGTWPFTWPTGQQPSGPCILIELDTLSTAAITAVVALVTMLMRATEHHTATALTQPQGEQPK